MVVVHADAWTSYGGSQFVDSLAPAPVPPAVSDDVVRFIDAEYRTVAYARLRATAGGSSGAIAAVLLPVLRTDIVAGGSATHAGNAPNAGCLSGRGTTIRAQAALTPTRAPGGPTS